MKGWTSLEDKCDDCNLPVMQSPDKTIEECAKCKKDYKQIRIDNEVKAKDRL